MSRVCNDDNERVNILTTAVFMLGDRAYGFTRGKHCSHTQHTKLLQNFVKLDFIKIMTKITMYIVIFSDVYTSRITFTIYLYTY